LDEPPTPTAAQSTPLAQVDSSSAFSVDPLMLSDGQLSVGAYDPWQALVQLPLSLEHWYVPQSEPRLLAGALAHARNRRTLLVTIEPYPAPGQSSAVLDQVVEGASDEQLRQLADVVRDSAPQPVLIRWGHEMDLQILYPWASGNSELYRAAFRHVVDVFRSEGANNARWVWSPAGEPNALDFYPGDDVVDYVGLTVLGDATWDADFGLPRRSLAGLLRPRYAVVQPIEKPMIIAELGVSGTPADQVAWLAEGAHALKDFPLIKAVVYFDDRNAANNLRVTQPDWRLLDPQALKPFFAP
jgi:beta-mannanase